MRVKAGITIFCFCAWSLFLCAESILQAQDPGPPYSALSPAPGVRVRTLRTSYSSPWTNPCWSTRAARSAHCRRPGRVAEATAVSRSEILVNGKAPGETSLIVWEAGGGRQFFNVIVRPSAAAANDRMEALRRELRDRASRTAGEGKRREWPNLPARHS